MDNSAVTPSGVPTDTAGNTYVQSGTTQQIGGGGGNMCMFYAYNCLGNASNVITLSLSGSTVDRVYDLWQFSGVPTTDPKIDVQFGSGNSGQTFSTASAVSHGAGSCVIVVMGTSYSSNGTGMNAGGSGYTFVGFTITGQTTNFWGDEYQVLSADNTPSMSSTLTSFAWGVLATSFGTPNTANTRRRFLLLGVGN
jgi:hypothetical protein